jgi:hypothetical protein
MTHAGTLKSELKLKLERLAFLEAQLDLTNKNARWEEVFADENEQQLAEGIVEIVDEVIEALERALALYAEAEEQAAANVEDAEDYRYRYC